MTNDNPTPITTTSERVTPRYPGLRPFGTPGAADPAEAGRRGGLAKAEAERERSKSVRDRLRDKVEADFEKLWSAFQSGLESDDERVRFAAAVAVLAEAYGKPALEIRGDPDRPLTFVVRSAFPALEERGQLEDGDPE